MTEYEYVIQVPLAGGAGYMDLCVCHSPEYAAAVVRALVEADSQPVPEVRVLVRPRMERRHGP